MDNIPTKSLGTLSVCILLTRRASASAIAAGTAGVVDYAVDKPNLIIILTGEQDYHDVDFKGCKDSPTPNLDSIAHNGVQFSNSYVFYSVCSPGRKRRLTGRYAERFGHEGNPQGQPHNPHSGRRRAETMPVIKAQVTMCRDLFTGKDLRSAVKADDSIRITELDQTAHPADTVFMIKVKSPNR